MLKLNLCQLQQICLFLFLPINIVNSANYQAINQDVSLDQGVILLEDFSNEESEEYIKLLDTIKYGENESSVLKPALPSDLELLRNYKIETNTIKTLRAFSIDNMEEFSEKNRILFRNGLLEKKTLNKIEVQPINRFSSYLRDPRTEIPTLDSDVNFEILKLKQKYPDNHNISILLKNLKNPHSNVDNCTLATKNYMSAARDCRGYMKNSCNDKQKQRVYEKASLRYAKTCLKSTQEIISLPKNIRHKLTLKTIGVLQNTLSDESYVFCTAIVIEKTKIQTSKHCFFKKMEF